MSWFARLRRYARDWRRGPKMAQEIDEELQFHFDALVEELTAQGASLEEARLAATRRLGRLDLVRDRSRYAKGVGLMDDLRHDVRYGLRSLLRQPGFAAVGALTLALGIGANTAIFTIVDAVLLKPLPYPDSSRLVFVFLRDRTLGLDRSPMGVADFQELEREQRSLESVAALTTPDNGFTFVGEDGPEQVAGTRVTAGFFSALGVKPVLGRTFLPGEDRPGRPPAVVVGSRFWRDRLRADPAAVGRTITLDQRAYTVVGVMPPDFGFGRDDGEELWPILQLETPAERPPYYLFVLGRLKPGTSASAAGADAARIAAQVDRQYPRSNHQDAVAIPMKEVLVGNARVALLVLLGAVGLVLSIAVANVANLQLARAAARQKEIAIRSALGAGRLRLVRQLLTESLLLGVSGGALALLVGYGSVRAVLSLAPRVVPRIGESTLDSRAFIFTAAIALLSGALFGLAPVVGLRVSGLDDSLKQGGRETLPVGREGSRALHRLLVVSELSLAVVLLIGAGLFIRSLARLQAVNPGFDAEHVVAMQLSLSPVRYRQATDVTWLYDQLLERIEGTPGVRAAAISLSLPPNLLQLTNPFHLEGQSYEAGRATNLAEEIPISEHYFRALGVPLVGGRLFDGGDRAPGHHALIINQAMALRYFGGRDPVGRRLQTGDANPGSTWYTIVGVVANVKYQGLAEKDQPTMYVPFWDDGWNPWFVRSMHLVVRTTLNPTSVVPAVRAHAAALDGSVPLTRVRTMQELLSQSLATPRFRTVLLGTFAALALALAAIGVYGVLAYSVARRRHEIGVRVALGARRSDVLRLVLGQGAKLALVGVGAGLVASLALTRVISSLLFGVSATDPFTFAGVAVLLALVALAASYIPARRAAGVDPLVALRCE